MAHADDDISKNPTCNVCASHPSTHRCVDCGRFVCERCTGRVKCELPLSPLLTDDQTDRLFDAIQARCRECADKRGRRR